MAVSSFNDLLQTILESGRVLIGNRKANNAEFQGLCEDLLSGKGEASGVALARLILDAYEASSEENRLKFFNILLNRFGADPDHVEQAIEDYKSEPGQKTLSALSESSEPRRRELLRRLNLAPGGTAAMVRMRAELLNFIKENQDLKLVDGDFQHLFTSWFNRGFLELHNLTWDTSASILEKLIRYEAVHAINGWDDLRRRLQPLDRRCFSFFHPRLTDEPLIFVEVALTKDIPDKILPILAENREDMLKASEATTAVFYSISNTQKGLAGISFGNFLIKQVAEDLRKELPNLKTFVTLSPAPAFARWLDKERANTDSSLFGDKLKGELALLDDPDCWQDENKQEQIRKPLMAAAACYYLQAKTPSGKPVDPVARFHLRNGARLEKLNFLGNPSAQGIKQSYGLMVNYLYTLSDIERNHEAFAVSGEVVTSSAIRKLLSGIDK